jgi:hypothetical protein
MAFAVVVDAFVPTLTESPGASEGRFLFIRHQRGKAIRLCRPGGSAMSAYQLFKTPIELKHDHAPGAERREHDRWNVHGVATAFCIAGEHFGEMYDLHMLDISAEGMGATCDEAIPPGSAISIGFEAPGYLAKRGEVLHCQPIGHGYRVAIRFDALAAA